MAEDKKSFVLYSDLIHTVNKLPNDKAGELFKHILSYVNDDNPVTEDILIQIAFEPIRQSLKRDLDKWTNHKDKKSISGREGNLKRWHLDIYNKYKSSDLSLEDAELMAKNPKASHTDKVPSDTIPNIPVNGNVNVSVNVNDIKTKKVKFNFSDSLIAKGGNKQLVSDWMLVRKNKKATNTETSFNSFISEIEKSKSTIDKVLKICIERDWKGFNAEWIKDYEQENKKIEYNFKVK